MGEREPRKEKDQDGESILVKDFIEPILTVTKEFLMTQDHLGPALFLRMDNDERGIVPLTDIGGLKSMEERQEYFSSLGLSIHLSGMKIREAVFVSEVWYVRPDEEPLDVPPSKHPKRKEAISIVGRNSQGTRFTYVLQPFGRDDQNRPVFETVEAEYNVPREEDQRSAGLIDHLFG